MAYLHFSELNSLQFQSQYNLFYMILLLLFMLCGPWIKPRKIIIKIFNDFKIRKKLCATDLYSQLQEQLILFIECKLTVINYFIH